ncbi:unnamed protein product [Fraxinus pennsylvanica]|uniref:BHLH domain-containing protein n=1 Tax=Fraxinus pennsylvanica TaxID=56036 RepID=A0AAD1ZUE5_9LAMI|nr:unnamed protein product [Fraxinus pennsylvanica]
MGALPGEPHPLNDTEVDDWLPCFVVLQRSCIYLFYRPLALNVKNRTVEPSATTTKDDAKIQHRGNLNPTTTSKPSGKHTKQGCQGSDLPKEEYIRVRLRSGQATNNHSLAERLRRDKISERMKFLQDLVPGYSKIMGKAVMLDEIINYVQSLQRQVELRREKISERMKFLQDLGPGCSKIMGKAVMLDEIINYMQSLQRQVEFLSMKLATVNPRLNFSIEGLLTKDVRKCTPIQAPIYD